MSYVVTAVVFYLVGEFRAEVWSALKAGSVWVWDKLNNAAPKA